MVYDLEDPADFFNVEPLTGIRLFPRTSRTGVAPALVVGFGTDLRVSERVALRFEITDAVSANPLDDSDFETSARFVGLAVTEDVVHNFLVALGVAVVVG